MLWLSLTKRYPLNLPKCQVFSMTQLPLLSVLWSCCATFFTCVSTTQEKSTVCQPVREMKERVVQGMSLSHFTGGIFWGTQHHVLTSASCDSHVTLTVCVGFHCHQVFSRHNIFCWVIHHLVHNRCQSISRHCSRRNINYSMHYRRYTSWKFLGTESQFFFSSHHSPFKLCS